MKPKDMQNFKCKIESKLDLILAQLSEKLENQAVSEIVDVSVEFKFKIKKESQPMEELLCVLNTATGDVEC